MSKENELLKNEIIAAFAKVPYPGDHNIGYDEERDEGATKALRGKNWQSVNPYELSVTWLGFVTSEAFLYYLPAYLLASFEDEEGDFTEALVNRLTPPKEDPRFPGFGEEFWVIHGKFTPAQKKVIADYIDWELENLIRLDQELGLDVEEYPELRNAIDFWKNS